MNVAMPTDAPTMCAHLMAPLPGGHAASDEMDDMPMPDMVALHDAAHGTVGVGHDHPMEMRSRGDGYEVRSSEDWEEARFQVLPEGNGLTMEGPMAIFDTPSRVLSYLDLGGNVRARRELDRLGSKTFREVIHPGAFSKSLKESPDIVLHYQHNEETLPLGRTKAGTLRFTEEARMIRTGADLPDNEWGRPVRDAVLRGDIGGISFRMGQVLDRWATEKFDDGYQGPVRHLHEIRLRREVSLVTFPGYDTPATIRAMAEEGALEPDKLFEAFDIIRTPDARLTAEQRDLLMAAINTRVDAPYLHPKLVQMRERLAAIA